jgi:hypothetical protein
MVEIARVELPPYGYVVLNPSELRETVAASETLTHGTENVGDVL